MPGNPLVRFDEGRVGRTASVALSPTLPRDRHRTFVGERSVPVIAKANSSLAKSPRSPRKPRPLPKQQRLQTDEVYCPFH